jgi:quercetin dioxygenase-like cupin family protein
MNVSLMNPMARTGQITAATLLMLLLVAVAIPALAQRAPDAVEIDPTHHHVLFENDHVRVFEALASPGARSPMHSHPPIVVVSLGKARTHMSTPDGSSFIFDLNPGQVLWLEDAEHSWELLSGNTHVIAVEPKHAQRAGVARPSPLPPTDAVAVDPTHHNVILENDHVRVLEVLASPGASSPLHTHPYVVVISLDKARSMMKGPDGNPFVFDLSPGQVFLFEGAEHEWELLSGQVHVIAVEIKGAR